MTQFDFARGLRHVGAWVDDYLAHPERYPVYPSVTPGTVTRLLGTSPPLQGDDVTAILGDFDQLIVPNLTHWNHPGFMAYFNSSGSVPGILAETLIAALNVNAMVWRSSPAATELEQVTTDWVRQMLGLPEGFFGIINEGGSASTLAALAAAREARGELAIRQRGLPASARLAVYCSADAHSSVDKAVSTLGLGLDCIRHIETLQPGGGMAADALARQLELDQRDGITPVAVVATIGTTSTGAVDPVDEIAQLCRRYGTWLHVDAAYGGSAAVLPEMRHLMNGWERADSIVVNPHKWMFVPLDCSILFVRDREVLKSAFSIVPPYLEPTAHEAVDDYMDYGISLGRRFRALKLWFVLRSFGTHAIAEHISQHIGWARWLADQIDRDEWFTRPAPVQFGLVTLRCEPPHMENADEIDRFNARIMSTVNAHGEFFLSHTRVEERFTIRVAIGNHRTEVQHVHALWRSLQQCARDIK